MTPLRTEQFVRLYARHEQAIYRFVYGILPNAADAQEVMQETAVALWRQFEKYDPEQPFVPWGCAFARFEVLKFYRKQKNKPLPLNEKVLEKLATQYSTDLDELNQRRRALDNCVEKLPGKDKTLLRHRYEKATTIREIAKRNGASEHTLYKNLDRIRRVLSDCISHAVATMDFK